MNHVEATIRVLDGQCVRLDLKNRWPNGHEITRMLIGTLYVNDEFFIVEEVVGGGKIKAALPYHQASFIRVDNDTGGSFCAVIDAGDGEYGEGP
jgi:hypothetical protein